MATQFNAVRTEVEKYFDHLKAAFPIPEGTTVELKTVNTQRVRCMKRDGTSILAHGKASNFAKERKVVITLPLKGKDDCLAMTICGHEYAHALQHLCEGPMHGVNELDDIEQEADKFTGRATIDYIMNVRTLH